MQRKPLPKPPKNNRQIQEYTAAVRRGLDSHFVAHTDKGWSVRRPNASRASGVFSTKREAVARAKKFAASTNGSVYVFTRDGHLSEPKSRR